jgi:hypothetical protein
MQSAESACKRKKFLWSLNVFFFVIYKLSFTERSLPTNIIVLTLYLRTEDDPARKGARQRGFACPTVQDRRIMPDKNRVQNINMYTVLCQ